VRVAYRSDALEYLLRGFGRGWHVVDEAEAFDPLPMVSHVLARLGVADLQSA